MSAEARLREQICLLAKSMFDRGLTGGSSGNISARLDDKRLLVTPTGSCFGRLDPARLSVLEEGRHVSGDAPTKEVPLHTAFYDTRDTGAVVHLHSSYTVALSVLTDVDPDNLIPPITAYGVMRLGKVALLPYFMPGDPAMGEAIRALKGKRSAVVLAHHGPVVADKDVESACYAMEELEETAKLVILTRGMSHNLLSDAQVQGLVQKFNVEWDD
ncbi:MAG: aldolase [Litoreibacter sp.]|nr:aldolase [Litoreibacter sp.]MCY4336664.1 aldolase [Litoreibacter sp.]